MKRVEIVVGGLGGQGVIMAGILLGTAATVFANLRAVQTQAYSSEQRGGMAKAEVIISKERIVNPKVRAADYLIALADDAIRRHLGSLKEGGRVIADSNLVTIPESHKDRALQVPATAVAEALGSGIAANLVLLGVFLKNTRLMPVEAMEKAIQMSGTSKAQEINLNAFRKGIQFS